MDPMAPKNGRQVNALEGQAAALFWGADFSSHGLLAPGNGKEVPPQKEAPQ
jgi:hypothetical protein